MPDSRQVSITLPLFGNLFATLPDEWQTEAVREPLLAAYRYELHCLINAAVHPDCQEPRLVICPWRIAGKQQICEFWVADAAIPWTPAQNFHGQNTSQWKYGGAIVVCEGDVSTHH
jgi:hypothetical protein